LSEKRCSNCGKNLPLDAKFCLNCGSDALEIVQKQFYEANGRSSPLTAGGVLIILGSCFAFVGGILGLIFSIRFASFYGRGAPFSPLLVPYSAAVGLFGILGFAFGLASGIQVLRRRHFAASIIGAVFVVFAGILNFLFFIVPSYGIGFYDLTWDIFVLFLGVPCFVFSMLALIFVAVRKSEFR
jgi:hypothetical protein